MSVSEKAIAILKILGYTPSKFSKSTQISPYRARKIFKKADEINCDEFFKVCYLLNIPPDTFYSMVDAAQQ